MQGANYCWKFFLVLFSIALPISGAIAQNKHPAEQKGLASINGYFSTSIRFVNNSNRSVKVYWLDYKGKRQLYNKLNTNRSYKQQTYLTHPWLITDIQDNALYIFFPDAQPRTIEIP